MKSSAAPNMLWIYKTLLSTFGPQGWWPVAPKGGHRGVYHPRNTRGRLTPAQRFEVAVGAILTQNTAWTNVEKALDPLHRQGLSPDLIRKTPARRLARWIRPSGYFNQKSKRLKEFVRFLEKAGGLDALLKRPTTEARNALLSASGIGPETADSILLYAGNHPLFVVDAYTRRFGQRFGLFQEEEYGPVQSFFMGALPAETPLFREYHALIVELGKRHCRKTPVCDGCPLRSRCRLPRLVTSKISH